jgi:hypothetical protein
MHVIGEERSERLDVIPAQYRVLGKRCAFPTLLDLAGLG